MNTQMNVMPEYSLETPEIVPAAVAATRPLLWSVRRELWENNSIFIAPLTVAVLFVLGFVISMIHEWSMLHSALVDPQTRQTAFHFPFDAAAFALLLTAVITGAFYCLDALYGERRDRSVLFWKSLPVSDLTTVLAKACIPLLVLPLITFAMIIVTQTALFLLSTAIALGNGISTAVLWEQLPLWKMWVSILCAIVTSALWYAPLYGWLLLVSSYARRATFLWAVLPPFAVCVVEKIAFNTSYFADMMTFRLTGWYSQAFTPLAQGGASPADPLASLTLGRFFSSPELWIGLVFAALFLAAAIQLRRSREAI
ncbi:MAG: ABC transporter permease [Terracidiphilus sp.]